MLMASLGETFVTKSYMKGKKMPNKKDYPNTWRPKSAGSEGPKVKPTSKKTMAKRSMPKRKAM
jgi:hypothetical protein